MSPPGQASHKRVAKLHGAYTAFIAAGVLSVVAGSDHIALVGWVVSLWALSLPWLVTLLLIDYMVRERQSRRVSSTRGIMILFGYGLSNVGTAILLGGYSWIAATLYLLSIVTCQVAILVVAEFGPLKGFEKL